VIDLFDLFDIYQNSRIDAIAAREAATHGRVMSTAQRLREMEQRHERMKLVTVALWQMLKAHTGLTDADLKQYIEKVDLADGSLDGRIDRKGAAMDCPHCNRRILKSAVVCPWCSKRTRTGDAFEAT
jgi:hypothetical protein